MSAADAAPPPAGWRRWARRAGGLLTLAGLVFLGRELVRLWDSLGDLASGPWVGMLLGGGLVYALLLAAPALAWSGLLGRAPAGGRLAGMRVYARANLLKYLPGNVFHFGGRQAMGALHGWPHGRLAEASLAEVALMPGLALLLGLGLGAGRLVPAGLLPGDVNWLAVACAMALLLVGLLARWRRLPLGAVLRAAGWLGLFYLGLGGLAVAVLVGLGGALPPPADLAALAGAFLLAWTAGFLVPGAPGGLGVRESVFVLLAAPLAPEATVLAAALGVRLATTLGDLLLPLLLGRGRGSA
ncbi:hypothetical protein [Roseospirillum parvum]|uniref:Lysylphosphatidylglycerol synthase TM region n=1 Tax=Roseospirillum parvum TaxID=83401 RepID=A0A1G8CZ91_9PROT|nr:hypothetical protein [Roseospirillum parvum]SDH50722.1 hypothetical protein SAMN05421742_107137 [Roseospirillum parvum]